jgi:ABC-type Mn2+/Zn2+ transport system permease subunit
MMVLAAIVAVASGIIGLYVSWYGDASSGAAIVLVATLIFGVAFISRSMFGHKRAATDAEAV